MSARGSLEDALRAALAATLDDEDVTITVTSETWPTASAQQAEVTISLLDAAAAPMEGALSDDPVTSDDDGDHPDTVADDEGDDEGDAEDADASDEEMDAPNESTGRPAASDSDEDDGPTREELDEEADAAADFVEALLDAFDLPGDLKIRVGDAHAEVEIIDVDGGALIGRRGQTLDAIQELVRCSLQRQFQRRTRVRVDIEGYRARRLEKLEEKTVDAIEEVRDTGKSVRLEPMDVFERKAVHGIVSASDGVESHSQGREPGRRVIIEPS